MKPNSTAQFVPGLLFASVVLVVLKLSFAPDLAWQVVLAPLAAGLACAVLMLAAALVLLIGHHIAEFFDRLRARISGQPAAERAPDHFSPPQRMPSNF